MFVYILPSTLFPISALYTSYNYIFFDNYFRYEYGPHWRHGVKTANAHSLYSIYKRHIHVSRRKTFTKSLWVCCVLSVASDVLLVKRYFTCQLTSHPHSNSAPGHMTPAQPHSEQHATIATTLEVVAGRGLLGY